MHRRDVVRPLLAALILGLPVLAAALTASPAHGQTEAPDSSPTNVTTGDSTDTLGEAPSGDSSEDPSGDPGASLAGDGAARENGEAVVPSSAQPSPERLQVGDYGPVFEAVEAALPSSATTQNTGAAADGEGPDDSDDEGAEDDEGARALALQDLVLILVRDGQVVARGSYGVYEADHVLPLGSASRWLVALAILRLQSQNQLELDDPLVRFFPSVPENKTGITVSQLLTDTAGLGPSHACLGLPQASLTQCAEAILQDPLRAKPGEELRHSDAGYQVLGRIAEIAAAAPWATVVESTLRAPLKLTELRWAEGDNPSIANGARATSEDMAAVLAALQSDDWLGAEGRAEALQQQARRAQSVANLSPETTTGLGLRLEAVPAPANAPAARGDVLQGVVEGSFGFSLWLDPSRRLAGLLGTIAPAEAGATVAGIARRASRERADALDEESLAAGTGTT